MEKNKSNPNIKIVEVCKEENRLINVIRDIRFGEVNVIIKAGKPYQIIERKERILLGEDGIFDNCDNKIE